MTFEVSYLSEPLQNSVTYLFEFQVIGICQNRIN
jgi:hypothetical protein